MATLESRLSAFISAVGADVKSLKAGRTTYTWIVGDATPTHFPTGAQWIIKLGLSTTVPAWVPVGSEIIRSSYFGA